MNKDTESPDITAVNLWEGIDRLANEQDGIKPKPSRATKPNDIKSTMRPMAPVPKFDVNQYLNPPASLYPGEQEQEEPKRLQSYQRFTWIEPPQVDRRYDEGTDDIRQAITQEAADIKAQPTEEEQKQAQAAAAFKAMFLDPHNLPAQPPAALRQGEHHLFTLGELFVIAGKAKSRKTFATAGLITAALARSGDPGGLQNALFGNLPSDRPKVLYVDTEQSAYLTGQAFRRARKLAGERYAQNIVFAHANGKSPAELMYGLQALLSEDETIGAVIFDNGGDLLAAGANDEAPSKMLAKELNEIAQRYQVALGVVVHTARTSADDDIGGHLGSQLAQRCAWHARVAVVDPKTKEGKGLSTIEHIRNRHQAPEQGLTFRIEDGLPVVVDYQNAPTERERQREAVVNRGRPPQVDPEDMDIATHIGIWTELWEKAKKAKTGPLTKENLHARLANVLAKWGKGKIGERRLIKFIHVALDEGLAVRVGNRFDDPGNEGQELTENSHVQ